jgi:hypothetical protein
VKSWLWLFLVLPTLANADGTRLVTETFDQTTTTQTNGQGKKVSWSSTTKGSFKIVNDPVLASGEAFEGRKVVGILPFASLSNPGDSLTVQFSFRLAGPITATDHGFKLGLFEGGDPNDPWFFAAGTGYRWNVSTGPYPIPASVVRESGGPGQKVLSGQDTNVLGQSSKPFSLNDTAKHVATIIMSNDDGTINLSLAIDGKKWVFTASDMLPPSTLAPTRFAIRSDANTFLFDDFTVDIKAKSSGASP